MSTVGAGWPLRALLQLLLLLLLFLFLFLFLLLLLMLLLFLFAFLCFPCSASSTMERVMFIGQLLGWCLVFCLCFSIICTRINLTQPRAPAEAHATRYLTGCFRSCLCP